MTNACINLSVDSRFRYLYCALYWGGGGGSKKAILQVLGTCEQIQKGLLSQTAKFLMPSSLGMISDSCPLCLSSNNHNSVFSSFIINLSLIIHCRMSRKHAFIAETAVSWAAVSTGLNSRYNCVSFV